jgi:phage baseplate assembly protein gpV
MASVPARWSAQLDYRTITVLSAEQQDAVGAALPDGATVTFDSAVKRLVCAFALEATSVRRAADQALRAEHRAVLEGAEAVGVRLLPAAEQQAEAEGNPAGVTVVGTVEAESLFAKWLM